MTKNNFFVKSIKEINLTINSLLRNNLNKLNSNNFFKITKSHKFFLLLLLLIIFSIFYLSIPNTYNKTEISKRLSDKLQNKYNLNFNLSQNFNYNFLPRPHFIFNNSTISKDQKEISKIEELKIYISLNNLFSYKNFRVQNLILEKSNFFLDNNNYDFFINLLDGDFQENKLFIKNSNIFYKNKNDEVLFINKIINIEYFYDKKDLHNKLISKNEIFNLPYSIELNQNNIEKKIFSKLNFAFLKLEIDNELDYRNEYKKGLANFKLNKNKFSAKYHINENNFIFNLFDDLENSNFSYEGQVNFNPFYSKLEGLIKEIDISYLLNSNSIILQLIKTEILNNKNLNFDLNFYADEVQNSNNFIKINLNSKIKEGLIDIDNTRFSWRDSADVFLENSLIYIKNGELILDGKFSLSIKNYEEIYKFLLTPKNFRKEFKNIEANFIYNFDQKILNLNNILIDKKNNKDMNKTLESLIFKKNKLQNRVYLKNILNKALKF